MRAPSEQPRQSRAIAAISAAIFALALSCAKPETTQSTTPAKTHYKAKIESDCTQQKEVEYKADTYFEGSRSKVKALIDMCIKGTVKRKGKSYKCKIWKSKLKSVKCE